MASMRYGFATVLIGTVVVIGALIFLLMPGNTVPEGKSLHLFYAAGLRLPVEEIVEEYRSKYGVQFQTVAAGSGELQGSIVTTGRGDLFLAADTSYLNELKAFEQAGTTQSFVEEVLPIAWQRPVIAVASGNPKKIAGLDDLLRDDVRASLPDPEITAIGRVSRNRLERAKWDAIWKHKHVGRSKVTLVAGDIEIGAADAGIVWDATASQYPQFEVVTVPEFDAKQNQIAIGVLRSTKNATRALHFARFFAARDRGLTHFKKHGYHVVEGDVWSENPEITLFSGGLNWVATEEIVKAFEKREGCTVLTRIGGCGQLVGEMKLVMDGSAKNCPSDLYFACDVKYMNDVKQWFGDSTNVTKAAMVIAVAKGNPKEIASLADLTQKGLHVGMCDANLSALGNLTKRLLDTHGLYEKVLENTKDEPATAAILVERVALGNLDAAIVYLPNKVKEGENVDVVPIDDPRAFAVQPIAVGKGSDHGQLAERLMRRILSPKSRDVFQEYAFDWLAGQRGPEVQSAP